MSITTHGFGSDGGLISVQGFGGFGQLTPLDACVLLFILAEAGIVVDCRLDPAVVLEVPADPSVVIDLDSETAAVLEVGADAEITIDIDECSPEEC